MIKLNCDLGEQPGQQARDLQLLQRVDAVSIACGGHAGNESSARYWAQQAVFHGKAYHLHLSYPDVENFGRRSLAMSWPQLAISLSSQRAWLPECKTLKLHGALYNDAAGDNDLSAKLVAWCLENNVDTVLAPPGSALERQSSGKLTVIREGFADRAYFLDKGVLALKPRTLSGAVHNDAAKVTHQIQSVLCGRGMPVESGYHPFSCETWCIHSDSEAVLTLIEAILDYWPKGVAEKTDA
ncbi:MAG: LamB/YcsF family protein [Pseudomonadales bacterium]|nr:LamB/YcsF family protein [Pseudomonadales bacterium]